jgi:hypothetical protein
VNLQKLDRFGQLVAALAQTDRMIANLSTMAPPVTPLVGMYVTPSKEDGTMHGLTFVDTEVAHQFLPLLRALIVKEVSALGKEISAEWVNS